MNPVLSALISSILASLRSRASLQAEILALRHQLAVYQRANKRPRLKPTDRILNRYFDYYHKWRRHLSLNMDCPDDRPVYSADEGKVVEIPDVGGLHHHYVRKIA